MCVTFQAGKVHMYTVKLKNSGKWMKIKQHSENVFKIISGNTHIHVRYRDIIPCRVSSVWTHLLWLFPQWRIWFPFAPPTQCFQIASEGPGSLLSSRQTGLGVQELYIAPPWRCAHTSTHTNAHAGCGMNKWGKVAASLFPFSPSPQFFNNFQSRVSSVP